MSTVLLGKKKKNNAYFPSYSKLETAKINQKIYLDYSEAISLFNNSLIKENLINYMPCPVLSANIQGRQSLCPHEVYNLNTLHGNQCIKEHVKENSSLLSEARKNYEKQCFKGDSK